MDILVVVDMQNDFISGSLGTEEAKRIVPAAAEKIKSFHGRVLFTRDTHEGSYLSTQEGKSLPGEHCVRGTQGWQIAPEIEALRKEAPVDKPSFGSISLAEILKAQHTYGEHISSITLIGLCTDICVISNAIILKAYLPEVPIIVDAACCAGVTPESHIRALDAMKMCQIDVINE